MSDQDDRTAPAATGPFWVSAFLDLAPDQHERGVAFWGEVTGYDVSPPRGPADEFATLVPPSGDDFLRVQRLREGPSRVHLDLHVGDPRAAADRAASLGATEVADEGDFVVLASPAGLTFCFVSHPASSVPPAVAWPGGRSQVDQVCLDVAPAGYEAECDFWQRLTGFTTTPTTSPEFRRLDGDGVPLRFLLQRLDGDEPARFHLDLAADDVEAEVARHVALGASVVAPGRGWTVLADPAGTPYCVTGRKPRDRSGDRG